MDCDSARSVAGGTVRCPNRDSERLAVVDRPMRRIQSASDLMSLPPDRMVLQERKSNQEIEK